MSKFRTHITITILCLLLCSCSAERLLETFPDSEASAFQDGASQIPENALSSVLNGDAFELVVPCENTVYGSGNKDGYYQIIANSDGSHNVVFIDYKTRQQIYLCADANCQHNTDQCSSWFPADDTQIWPIACDDQIFFVHNSWVSTSYIEKADPDGSNRQMLCELENGSTIDSGAAYKSGYLVLMVDTLTNQEDSVNHAEHLIAVDTKTGENITLYENISPEGQATDVGAISAFFQGVTTHGFIVKTIETGATPDIQVHNVLEIPFDGSDIHRIVSFQTGEMQGLPCGNFWFYLKMDKELQQLQLGYIDPETNENHIVVSDLDKTIPVVSLGDVFIRNFVDEWVVINAMTSMSLNEDQDIELRYSCYAINQNTGEIRELDLFNYYHATQVPIEIYDEWEDNLLVQSSINEIAPKDQNEVMTQLEYTLAFINKDDYLSSTPTYKVINML